MKKLFSKIAALFSKVFRKKKLPKESSFLIAALDLAEQYTTKKEGRLNEKRRIK